MNASDPIEIFNRMISKNPEKRFIKNYDFVFGNNYLDNNDFKNAVDNFVNSNENVYNAIYDKVMNKVDLGTSEQSVRTFVNMTDLIQRKENLSTQELQSRIVKNLSPTDITTNKEIYDSLGLDSSIWNTNKNSSKTKRKKTKEELEQKNIERQQRQKDREYRIKEDTVEKYREELKRVQGEHRDLYLRMEYGEKTPEILKKSEMLEQEADSLIKRINKMTNNLTSDELDLIHEDKNKVLQSLLNPPREGAPMFEGLAVPSEFVDKNGNIKPEYISKQNNTTTNVSNNKTIEKLNEQWKKEKQLEFNNRGQQIKDEFSDLSQYDAEKISDPNYDSKIGAKLLKNDTLDPYEWDTSDLDVSDTPLDMMEVQNIAMTNGEYYKSSKNVVEETAKNVIENTAETIIENTVETVATNVVKEGAEKLIKEATGLDVELNKSKNKPKKKKKKKTKNQKHKTKQKKAKEIIQQNKKNTYKPLSKDEINKQYQQQLDKITTEANNTIDSILDDAAESYRTGIPMDKLPDREGKYPGNISGRVPGVYDAVFPDAPEGYYVDDIVGIDKADNNRLIKGEELVELPEGVHGPLEKKKTRRLVGGPDTDSMATKAIKGLKDLSIMELGMSAFNVLGAVGDYKDARRKGHGVVSSAVRAGAKFALDEAMGFYALPFYLIKDVPKYAIQGADMLYKENRRMNSAANNQTFGTAQFADNQQLATMRQSGLTISPV